jgi:hypothetical protein
LSTGVWLARELGEEEEGRRARRWRVGEREEEGGERGKRWRVGR